MPTIGAELLKDAEDFERDMASLLDEVADACLDSIRDGSPITSTPGLPRIEGDLYRSWTKRPLSAMEIEVASDSPYAMAVEHHATGQHGGGPRNWALTLQHFGKLVKHAVNRRRALARKTA